MASLEMFLRQRGYPLRERGSIRKTLLSPNGKRAPTQDALDTFYTHFGNRSFRKVLRRLTNAESPRVSVKELEDIAGAKVAKYVSLLEEMQVAERFDNTVELRRRNVNIGPTLEWYVAELCRRYFGGVAEWGVRLENVPDRGDYDVLTLLSDTLVYIETKSAPPSGITDVELRHFLQRNEELKPNMSVLLVDTENPLAPLRKRLEGIIFSALNPTGGSTDGVTPTYIEELPDVAGVYFIGWQRTYIVASKPSIEGQLGRCLKHYHTRGKHMEFWDAGGVTDFLTPHA